MSEDLFKDYVPEILVYDENIDGSYEHKIRQEHLDVKVDLLKKIRKAKSKIKGGEGAFRQPIRTENEK